MSEGHPKRSKRLTLEERIELARRYHAGETPKALAEAYGVSRRHVTRLARHERGEAQEVRDPSVAVSFRAAGSEVEAFDAAWREAGFASRSQALQALVRARCGVLDLARQDLGAFCEALQQVRDVSESARLLAKAVQRGMLTLSAKDRNLLSELLDFAQQTFRDLAGLKAAALQRRSTGWTVAEGEGPGRKIEAVAARADVPESGLILPLDPPRAGPAEDRHDLQSRAPEHV